MEDKVVGRVTEAAGSLTGDETLEAEGRAGRSGAEKYLPSQKGEGQWKPKGRPDLECPRTKDQAVRRARELVKAHEPRSHLINGKEGDRTDFASTAGGVFSPFSRADAF